MRHTGSSFSFIILLGISASVVSCNSPKKEIPAAVLFTQTLVSAPGGPTTVEVPKGSALKYLGEASADSIMWKVQFKNNTGWLPRWSIALKGTAGVIITNGKVAPEESEEMYHDLPAGTVVAVDTTVGERIHIRYSVSAGTQASGWFTKDLVSLDTADVAIGGDIEAINNIPRQERPKAVATLLHNHPNSGFVSVISVNLVEAPGNAIADISEKYGFVIDKGAGKITMLRSAADTWLTEYLTDILNYPFGDQVASPTSNYFQRYVDQLPAFVKNGPRYDGPNMGEEQSVKAYLLFRLDRRPENIKKLYPIFRSAILPHVDVQSIRIHMNYLVAVYDHVISLPNYKQVCADISKQVAARDAQIKYLGSEAYDQLSIYQPIFDAPTMEKFPPFYGSTMGIWYHSFWVRRIREGNADVIYGILKDLQGSVQATNLDTENEEVQDSPPDGGAEPTTMTCVFQNYTVGDCGHVEFDCGDYGDADTSQLSSEGKELWNGLGIEDQDGPRPNPIYKGRKFQMTVGTSKGDICNEGQGGQGQVPLILSFILLDK